jgi:hypothetical protein
MCARASDARAWLAICGLAAALCACVHTQADSRERLAQYRAHAGRPVPDFGYVRNMRWEALGNQALAVWPRRDNGFLLEMASPCPGLDEARSIQITHADGRVRARVDGVRVASMPGSRPMQRPPCPILLITPILQPVTSPGDLRPVDEPAATSTAPASEPG